VQITKDLDADRSECRSWDAAAPAVGRFDPVARGAAAARSPRQPTVAGATISLKRQVQRGCGGAAPTDKTVRGESELHGGGDPARRLSLSNFGSGQSERMDCLVDLYGCESTRASREPRGELMSSVRSDRRSPPALRGRWFVETHVASIVQAADPRVQHAETVDLRGRQVSFR
jgi:hypothetical protein